MMNRFLYLKRMLRTILLVLLLSMAGMTKAQTGNITFADANVKAICVANWDTDGDGELNTTEAAAVTSLDGAFMFDDGITSFNELQFFTGLTSFGEDEFNSCTSLASITIPNAVTSIGNYAFSDCSSLTSMTSYACTPPALGNDVFYNVPSILVLNVPCHTSAMYQEADGWSDFSNYEEFEYGLCPIPFADATVKAICVAHWDTNEDGELSYAEATAVTNLGTYFKSTAITSFDELEYFTSLTSLPNTAFYGCTSLASIALPASVSALGNGSFYNCTNLATMTVYAETPPTVGTNALKNVPIEMVVYVPCGTYAAYHTADGWSEFTILQQSGSCPIVFADANVKALCVANWDTNGDGELSYDEAAAVTDLGEVFKDNYYSITSFNELQYFINLTSIGNYAFSNCRYLTSIKIPNTVTSIGNCAFSQCYGLTSIEIPNSVTLIGNNAFWLCSSLISIEIPNSVTTLTSTSFGRCSSLEQIIVDSGNTVYDSRDNCNAIINTSTNELVTGCMNTVIPNTVASIQPYAFENCIGLTSIVIPNSVTSIGAYAFNYCNNLTMIEIPNSVTYIGPNPFGGCSGLEQIMVASDNAYYDSRENCNAIIRTSDNALVTGCKNTVIPSSVTSIGSSAFYYCTSLTSIEIPSSVTSIGSLAFDYCTSLTSLASFADTPPTLGNDVFYSVNKSIPVYVPSGTVSAYQTASGWSEFTNIQEIGPSPITFADANVKALCVANWDTNGDGELSYDEAAVVTDLGIVFRNKSNIIVFDELQYFTGLTSIGNKAFQNCGGLTSIEIPNSVTFIGDFAFDFCTSLTSIEIPNSVTLIGNYAFYYCANLISIEIPNAVALIGKSSFYHCTSLTSIEIPNSVTSIGDGAFSSCSGLTSIEIPNSVTFIGDYAFQSCTGLSSIEIPSSVTSIGTNPFLSCSGLEQVVVDSGNEVYDSRDNCNAIIETSINVLVAGCKNTIIPNSVMSIGNSAFQDCVGLTSIEIPNSMSFIGSNAFYGCCSLVSITVMADNPPDLGNNVFYGVNTDILVYVPCASLLAYQNVLVWNAFTNYVPATTCASGEIIVMVNPYEGGLVTGTGYYEGGATCTLTAIANTGYSFINWSKDDVEVSNSEIYSFVVAGDASFVANFIAMSPLPVVAEYYPDPNETNSPYVKVHWAASSFEAQIGEGSSTFGYFPFYTLYNYSIAENLFLASELEAAGVTSSPMTSLSWYATNAPGYEQQGISIWMANVSDTELTTTSHTVSDMTLVYTGAMTPEIGWNEFVFNEGTFAWDGVSNVLIFCQRNNGAWNSTVQWQANDVGFNASSYCYRDSEPYNVNVASTMYTSHQRPDIIMKGYWPMTYNLYRSNCDGTDAQLIAENLNDTQYIDETWWQLENGSYKYGLSVADSTNTDIFWSNCIEKQGDVVVQTITLSQGTNWFSTYLDITLDDLKAVLVAAMPNNDATITIKSKAQNVKYQNGRWTGSLTTFDVTRLYMIIVPEACEISLEGVPIDPSAHTVTITPGANWIAFPYNESMTVMDFFGSFPINNDVVKSKFQNTRYSNGRWGGQLNTLIPGQGYIYNSAATDDRTFTFPTSAK